MTDICGKDAARVILGNASCVKVEFSEYCDDCGGSGFSGTRQIAGRVYEESCLSCNGHGELFYEAGLIEVLEVLHLSIGKWIEDHGDR